MTQCKSVSSPVLFVPKKNKSSRLCINYRALNKQTIKNQVSFPRIAKVWDQVEKAKYFSTIDLRSQYHHIKIEKSDILKTVFRTRYGQFKYLVTSFKLTDAP